MLDWVGGQNHQAADDSEVMEPPETPAPLFALRAFQSALFGTPKADEEDNTKLDLKSEDPPHNSQARKAGISQQSINQKGRNLRSSKADVDLAVTAMASPTKSILMTPGTASNRRKTVSFGESVVDNERKSEDTSKSAKTPVTMFGDINSQWTSSSAEGKRSKLTQTLMNSREKSPNFNEKLPREADDTRPTKPDSKLNLMPAQDDNEDTINMNEPRSRSGKYWKAEFDSYRTKTALEIKRLIQYRSAAKTYAKKKDEEAYRLAAKLKEEELRVEEMERHVTQLASTMVAENTRADKEQLVQDLTKQTALALQYKHKVSLLRKALEQHGVVGSEVDDIAGPHSGSDVIPRETSEALRKTQQALAQANARIEELKQQQSDFETLKGLALSSEQKASELEKENTMLKHTLARVKQETSKYEGRRKEREAKLKQREAKLEMRIQEYRERLKSTTRQHRQQEEDLKAFYNDERNHMQEQIDMLKTRLRAFESGAEIRARSRSENRGDYYGIQVHDFGTTSPQKEPRDETEETDQPPSPSPRPKDRLTRLVEDDLADLDLRKAMKEMGIEDIDDKFNNLGISPLKRYKPPRYQEETESIIPPSSPPEIPIKETTNIRRNTENRLTNPSHATTSLLGRRNGADDSHQIRTDRLRSRRSATKYSLDALSALPDTYLLDRAKKRQSMATTTARGPLSVDREMAAQARLKQKEETRQGKEDGKENMRTTVRN
ncbi:spindle pole body formation-associated protein-domain-containing protein [Aspergillus egyptiacus]|nr:spindle pole body formation-associated protein-domain-containing protein [Aspergillus egyptiacus]